MTITLKPPQGEVFLSPERFRVLVAGRRFGKTYLSLAEMCREAVRKGSLVWYVAPTIIEANRIAWEPLKEMTRPFWASRPNETKMRIRIKGGGTLYVKGANRPDTLRGNGLDLLVLDEYAWMKPEAWGQVLRPALADKRGRALFIGTPQGHNHFHDLVERAAYLPDWKAFHYTTAQGGNVTVKELESAALELDERAYRQEFEASFENMGVGRAYHAFSAGNLHRSLRFDSRVSLCWTLDFNLNPFCSVLAQVYDEMVRRRARSF
jgi:hypothetical protein